MDGKERTVRKKVEYLDPRRKLVDAVADWLLGRVRNDAAGEGVTSRELVEEARRVARNYAGGDHGRFSRAWRELSPAVYTLMGAGAIGLLWLIVALM